MIKIHVAPEVNVRAVAQDLLSTGAVGIDGITECLHGFFRDVVLDNLGFAGDAFDVQMQIVDTSLGPVLVLREANVWSAARARREIIRLRDRL